MDDDTPTFDLPELPSDGDRTAPSRRRFLGGAGLLGVAGLAGISAAGLALTDTSTAAAAGSCSVTPSVTEGPYWLDTQLLRSDVRANADGTNPQAGVKLMLTVRLFGNSACTDPLAGAYVDIWHANPAGHYSDFNAEGTEGQTWLRGYQISDADGTVTFTTTHPGWYTGRAIHIHVRVRTYSGTTKATDFTSQFFFDEAVNSAVIATSGYKHDSSSRTLNTKDGIYNQEVSGGGAVLVATTGDATSGYTGTVSMVLAAAATAPSSTTTTSSTSNPAPVGTVTVAPTSTTTTVPSPNTCRAWLTGVTLKRSHHARTLRVSVKASERVTASVYIRTHGRWRRIKVGRVATGKHTVIAHVPKAIKHGRTKIYVRLSDGHGAYRHSTTTLTL